MGSAGITNKGPINTQTTGQGAIAGFDPIMKMHRRANKRLSLIHIRRCRRRG